MHEATLRQKYLRNVYGTIKSTTSCFSASCTSILRSGERKVTCKSCTFPVYNVQIMHIRLKLTKNWHSRRKIMYVCAAMKLMKSYVGVFAFARGASSRAYQQGVEHKRIGSLYARLFVPSRIRGAYQFILFRSLMTLLLSGFYRQHLFQPLQQLLPPCAVFTGKADNFPRLYKERTADGCQLLLPCAAADFV